MAWNLFELKLTSLCSAAAPNRQPGGKPLYPKPKELGFTGCFYKSGVNPISKRFLANEEPLIVNCSPLFIS
jgi:hypothetical protein